MKLLYLIFFRIQQYFLKNRLVFLLFLIGGVLSSLIFIYFYGNAITIKSFSGTNDYALRRYELYFSKSIPELTQDQMAFLKKYPLAKLSFQSKIEKEALKSDDMGTIFQKELNQTGYFVMASSLLEDNYLSTDAGRVQFTKEEKQEGKYVVVLPPDFLKSSELPPILKIRNKEYQIIGIAGNAESLNFYIPFSIFQKEGFQINHISFALSQQLSTQENKEFENNLQILFPTAYIQCPSQVAELMFSQLPKQILTISVVYILSILSFMFLMKFLVDANSGEDIIYSFVGATKKIVIKIIMLQNLILTLLCGLTGVIFHIIFRTSFFELINVYPNIQYTFWDYIFILIMMIVISTLVTIPFLWNYYRQSLISLKQKYLMED